MGIGRAAIDEASPPGQIRDGLNFGLSQQVVDLQKHLAPAMIQNSEQYSRFERGGTDRRRVA
jgi:hypothetical protein